ncbi:hypothetical protein ACFWY5_15310 [Nonomuraea sp. NPDC059007]|uniref:hypothetical protein n=1 Tax=Nonomuraea sp. NPDC059007 TaxID=3346692 RepID=UPI003695DDAE
MPSGSRSQAILDEPPTRTRYPLFGVALSLFMVLPPEEASDLLRQRLAALTAAAEEIGATIRRARDQDLAWWFLIEEDYRLAKVEAERAFVERLAASVTGDDYHQAWNHHFKGKT